MRIHSISLKGLTVFKEPVSIDFDQLPAGLIAVVGSNGQGKTTLTEAPFVALFRELPSRDKFNLYRYCHGKDAFVEFTFSIGGHRYKSKILINAHSEDMKAFLDCDGTPVDDCRQGKLAPHTKAVERTVGSAKLALSSIFGVQTKRGNFAEMAISERKNLFIELLGLGQFPGYEKQAKLQADAMEKELNGLRLDHAQAVQDADRVDKLGANIAACTMQIADQSKEKEERTLRLQELRYKESTLSTDVATMKAVAAERQRDFAARSMAQSAEIIVVQRKVQDRRKAIDRERTERTNEEAALQSRLGDLAKRITNNEELLQRADDIRTAVEREALLKAEIERLEQESVAAVEAEQAKERASSQRYRLMTDHDRVLAMIVDLEESAAELKQVPCEAAGIYSQCVKITGAIEKAKKLPTLQQQKREILASLETVNLHLGKNGTRPSAEVRADRQKLSVELDRVSRDARLVASIETATQRIEEHRTAQRDAQSKLGRLKMYVEGEDPLLAELTAQMDRLTDEQLRLSAGQPTEAPAWEAPAAELREVQREVDHVSSKLDTASAAIASIVGNMQAMQEEKLRLSASADRVSTIKARAEIVANDLADWALLGRACGKDGIPALEIDAVGPAISALVNDLLASCFSTRFSVQLTTQRSSADGKKQIEDFAIRVIDTERGRDGMIDDLSGGEKVIVSEALAIAIGLYNKSGHELQTLWRDEIVGSLDSNNAVKYVAMMRRAMQMGNFHRMLIVVHNQEVAELCDARIRCHDGTVSVEL